MNQIKITTSQIEIPPKTPITLTDNVNNATDSKYKQQNPCQTLQSHDVQRQARKRYILVEKNQRRKKNIHAFNQ